MGTDTRDLLKEALHRPAVLHRPGCAEGDLLDRLTRNDSFMECSCGGTSQFQAAARATAPTGLPDADAPLSLRRHAAADLCVALSRDLTALGFGCEIIATWDTDAGSERVAAHVTTANPQRAALSASGEPE